MVSVRLLALQFGLAYFGQICLGVGKLCLCQARLLRGHVAPLFHNRPLHLPGIGSRPGTHLLRHVHALLDGFQLGHQLRHMLARSLRFKATLLLWRILHHSLNFVIALQWTLVEYADEKNVRNTRLFEIVQYLLEATASRGADLPRFFCAVMGVYFFTDFLDTLGISWGLVDQCFFLDTLVWLSNVSLLRTTCRPLEATLSTQWWWCSRRCWACTSPPPPFCIPPRRPAGGSLSLLRLDTTLKPGGHLDVAFLLLGPTLWLVLGSEKKGLILFFSDVLNLRCLIPADLLAPTVAVFHKRLAANSRLKLRASYVAILPNLVWSHRFVESDLLVFDEAVLPEVFLTFLLLLGLVLGDKCLMTP